MCMDLSEGWCSQGTSWNSLMSHRVQRHLCGQHAEAVLVQLRQRLWSQDDCIQREHNALHNAAHLSLTGLCKWSGWYVLPCGLACHLKTWGVHMPDAATADGSLTRLFRHCHCKCTRKLKLYYYLQAHQIKMRPQMLSRLMDLLWWIKLMILPYGLT